MIEIALVQALGVAFFAAWMAYKSVQATAETERELRRLDEAVRRACEQLDGRETRVVPTTDPQEREIVVRSPLPTAKVVRR